MLTQREAARVGERKEKKAGERVGGGGSAVGASFQVSNTTSGDGFKPNSPPPINTQAEREYISCLTIIHFEKKEKKRTERRKRKPSGAAFTFINRRDYRQKVI